MERKYGPFNFEEQTADDQLLSVIKSNIERKEAKRPQIFTSASKQIDS